MEDAPAAQSATNAPPSPWGCFAVTVGIASAPAAAQVITSWLCRQTIFKFTRGAPRYHFTASAKFGHHQRGFCAECGSRLTGGENPEGTSPIVGINAGSLDDPSWFHPQFDIFASDAQPWDQMDPAIPKYDKVRAVRWNSATEDQICRGSRLFLSSL